MADTCPLCARIALMPLPRRPFTRLLLVLFALLMLAAAGLRLHWKPLAGDAARTGGAMLLAPMVGVVDTCIATPEANASAGTLAQGCTGKQGSAAALVESTLRQLQPTLPPEGTGYPLGYTLPVPLLQLFKAQGGDWVIDEERVQRVARTVHESARPLILYLFATHFSSHAPIEEALARDPGNLAQTRDGPLPVDSYHGDPLYPWTVARTDNTLTQRRVQAARALLGAVCALPEEDLRKIRGVTLLGELQQMFPHFETGMGFDLPYRVSDYSPTSVAGFRAYLRAQFGDVAKLNAAVGARYASFDEVVPPSRDIRSEPLTRYTEHMDSWAHGVLPISGWVWVPGRKDLWVQVYRNGGFLGRVKVNQGRQDVLQARPEFGSADVGWRLDMDFRELPPGLHRISAMLELAPGRLVPLGEREIAIMDEHQRTPQPQPPSRQPLPTPVAAPEGMQGHLDVPLPLQSYYYNPLAPFWLAYRRQQVAQYLQFFDRVVAQSCLRQTPRYTHQILPQANPGWDENKFAVGSTLRTQGDLRLGVSLYGNASYDADLAQWLGKSGQHAYGITEFHPLRAMDAAELGRTLQMHARRGAKFLSFFLEPYWEGAPVTRAHNAFSLDPQNPQFGSAPLYEAMRQVLGGAPAGASGR